MRRRHAVPVLALAAALSAGCTSSQPCPNRLQECSGTCVDVQGDPANCGRCGNACGPGEGCVSSVCTGDAVVACRLRTGGAFVTLGACGAAVKLWVESPEFVAASQAAVGLPTPGVPLLALRGGIDCDAQWSWHVNPATAAYASAPPDAACDVCPNAIEANPSFVSSVGSWCPTAARQATVLAVDVRR
jgi:hypothetical protein